MYITNKHLKTIEDLLDILTKANLTTKEKAAVKKARSVTLDLRNRQKKLNERTRQNMAKYRAEDPLYGRSAEYKQKRMAKMKFDKKGIPYFVDSNPHLGCEWNSCAQF